MKLTDEVSREEACIHLQPQLTNQPMSPSCLMKCLSEHSQDNQPLVFSFSASDKHSINKFKHPEIVNKITN